MSGFKDKATEQNYYQKNKERIKLKARERHQQISDDPELRERRNKMARESHARSPERQANSRWTAIRIRYGLSKEDYEALLARQGGVCAICKCNRPKGCSAKGGGLYVDHDHVTMKVRGLLCTTCNAHLATFESHRAEMETYIYSSG